MQTGKTTAHEDYAYTSSSAWLEYYTATTTGRMFSYTIAEFLNHSLFAATQRMLTRNHLIDGYHIYRDSTGFEYNLTLARADLTYNINERYYIKVGSLPQPVFPSYYPRRTQVPLERHPTQCLQIYETHVEPHKYACFVTYSSPRSPYIKEQLAPTGSSFELAYANFRDFFKLKTKMAWEDRLLGEGGKDATAFVWQPPAVTEPQGMMVKDYLGLNG